MCGWQTRIKRLKLRLVHGEGEEGGDEFNGQLCCHEYWCERAQSYPIGWQRVKFRGSARTSKSPFLQPIATQQRGHPRKNL